MRADVDQLAPPRAALIGAGVMIAVAFAAAVIARTSDFGATRVPDSPVVESRMLLIVKGEIGSATVTDVETGRVHVAGPGQEEGFIWGAVNGLSYGRAQTGAPADAPYELARRADGRLTLTDLITGQKVFLDAFGKDNAAAFARLLDPKEPAR